MENNLFNKFILFLMIDVFIYLFYHSYKFHKLKFETTAAEDKLIICLLSTAGIKALEYAGRVLHFQGENYELLSFLGDFGISLSIFLVALVIADMVKKVNRKNLI